jgi:hypothetical protein
MYSEKKTIDTEQTLNGTKEKNKRSTLQRTDMGD